MNKDYQLPNMGGVTISNRLAMRLVDELRAGMFKNAARLPSEVEMAELFGVSRSVIRDVLANLEREGFIERGRGVGTLVNRNIVQLANRVDLKREYYDMVAATGAVPSTDCVQLYQRAADEELAEKLAVDVGEPLIVCEKRILASGRPAIYSIDHLPETLFEDVAWKRIDWSVPVFNILWEQCGIMVDTNITRLAAVCGPAPIRERLEVAKSEALILLDEVGYYKLSRPIIHSYGFYTKMFDFTLLRKKF